MTSPTQIRNSPSGPEFDVAGAQGAFGGAFTFPYAFSIGTPPPDPGLGQVKLNLGPQNSATEILVSTVDANNALIDSALATIDDSTNPIKGFIRLVGETDTTKWLLFTVTAISAEIAGLRIITVTCVASSSPNPFSDLDPILFCFDTSGDKGDTGPTEGWAASLAIDNHSGANDPIIDPGQSLLFIDQGLITAGTDVLITATGGDATVSGSDGAQLIAQSTDAEVEALAGDARVTAAADASLTATGGTATVAAVAGAAVVTGQTAASMTATAGPLALSSPGGTITASAVAGLVLETVVANAVLRATNSQVVITGQTGASLTATTGSASLTAAAGAVGLIASTNVALNAGGFINAAATGAVIFTAGAQLSLTGSTTASLVGGTDATVLAATGIASLVALAGAIAITAATSAALSAATGLVLETATGDAVLRATSSQALVTGQTGAAVTATTGDLILSALAGVIQFVAALGFSFTATTGNITITAAAGSITLDGAVNATLQAGSGTALVRSPGGAAQVLGQTGASVTATTGPLALAASAAAATLTAATTASITAASGLTLQTTTGNAALSATNSLATVTGQTGASVTATTGTLALAATAAAATLTAGTTVAITGATGASLTATTGTLALAASAAAATLTAATTIGVTATSGLTLQTGTGNAVLRATASSISIDAQGTGNDVTVTAADAVTITATAGALALSGGTTASLTGATGASVTATTGDLILSALAGTIQFIAALGFSFTATTGNITITATTGNITLAGGVDATLQAGSGTALVRSTGGAAQVLGQTGASVTATTGSLALAASAAAATLTAATTVAITAASGLTLQTTTGNAALSATNSLATVTGQTGASVTATTGTLALAATAAAATLTAGSTITVTAATTLLLRTTNGTATLQAQGAGNNASVTSAAVVALTGATGLTATATTGTLALAATAAAATLTAGSTITVTAATTLLLRTTNGTATLQAQGAGNNASVTSAAIVALTGATGLTATATTGTLALAATAAAATLTAGSTITVTAATTLLLQTTNGAATLQAGGVNNASVIGGNAVVLTATANAIVGTSGTDTTFTATGLLTMTANGGAASLVAGAGQNAQVIGANAVVLQATAGVLTATAGTTVSITGATGVTVTSTTGALTLNAAGGALNMGSSTTTLLQAGTSMIVRTTNGALTILAQGAANPVSVSAAAGAATLQSGGAGNNANLIAAAIAAITGATGITATATTGNVDITASAAAINLSASTLVTINNFLRFTSQAASTPVLGAGQGMFWVLTATPTTPQFTDSANTDWELATLPIQPGDLAPQAEGTTLLRALGTGTGTPIAGTGAQLAQNIRFGTDVDDATVGTQNAFVVSPLTDNIRFTPASALTINGIAYAGPVTPSPAGKEILLYNSRTSGQNVTIAHDSASATDPTFRIFCPNNVNVVLRPGDSCYIRYAFSRWILATSPQSVVANDTFPANVSGGTAQMSQKTFTSLVSATTSLAWDATNKRIDYIGSTSAISLTPSGSLGVVDISTLQCGGVLTMAPTANCTIDGFTAKADGFWFELYYGATTGFTITINDNIGATTTTIRTPSALNFIIGFRATLRFYYSGSRWQLDSPQRDTFTAAGQVLGNRVTATASVNAFPLTGGEVGALVRWLVLIDTTSTGTITSYAPTGYVSGSTNYIRISPAGNVILRGMPLAQNSQITIRVGRGTAFTVQINHEDALATAGEAFNCPDNVNLLLRAGESCIINNSESRNNVVAAGKLQALRKNSTGTVFTRAQWNLIEGAGISATIADDAVDNEVDITLDQANNVQEDSPTAAGVYEPTLNANTRIYRVNPAGDFFVSFTGIAFTGGNTGKSFMMVKQGLDGWCEVRHNVGVTAVNGFFTPDEQPMVLTVANSCAYCWYQTTAGRWNVAGIGTQTTPWNQARQRSPLGATCIITSSFVIFQSIPAGAGGAPDDVTIFNANIPFSLVLADVWFMISTAVVGGTVQLCSAAGGLGVAFSNAMAATPVNTTSRLSANFIQGALVSTSMFLRRSDSAIAGQILILAYRF